MRLTTGLLVWAALLPVPLLAQKPLPLPVDSVSTEPDQELDDFSGRFKGIHRITAKMRGVRGVGKTAYLVSSDGQQLSAFRANHLLWTTDVVAPFKTKTPAARISSLVLSSNILFVSLAKRGMAEVDRNTGKIVSKYFDRDPNHIVAEPH
jgi:hypothetical protein